MNAGVDLRAAWPTVDVALDRFASRLRLRWRRPGGPAPVRAPDPAPGRRGAAPAGLLAGLCGRGPPAPAPEAVRGRRRVDDPSLRYLEAQFADEFEAALARACAALTDRDRTILRLRFADDLKIDQIGGLYGVHRATVARWIARIRDLIFAATRNDLVGRLRLDESDFDSLLRLARSQLDLSLSAVLYAAKP